MSDKQDNRQAIADAAVNQWVPQHTQTSELPAPSGSALEREELEEARALILECARKHGMLDAKEGVTIPPAEFCEDTKVSKMLRAAWLQGWHSPNAALSGAERKP